MTSSQKTPDITAGTILILSALISLFAVAHHPVISARERAEIFQRIPESASADRLVHGALILCAIATLFAFCRFAQRQGIGRAPVLSGLIFYALGTATSIGAALIDGFFVPEIGNAYQQAVAADVDAGIALLRFCSIAIQLFTKLSVIAISAAILLWSASFVRAGRGPLLAAVVGFAAALIETFILVYGGPITAHTIIFVLGAQMIWYFIVGLFLTRGVL